MAIRCTFHGQYARDANGNRVEALPSQIGNFIAVADGAESAALEEGIYRVVATSDSLVRHGLAAQITNGAGGATLKTDASFVLYVKEGHVIGCSAYA